MHALLLLTVLTTLTSACLYPRSENPSARWSYDGETGPLDWHNLNPNNTLCGAGKHQSPINITPNISSIHATKEPLKLSYPRFSSQVDVENNGHSVVFTPKSNENYTSVLEGKEYKLLQFHFHTPSEHRFLDESYPLEVHFVHQDKDGKLAVVGIFFDLGFECLGDQLLRSTTDALKYVQRIGEKATIEDISFSSIMSVTKESKIYTYAGSLTTPPCSEGVTWFVVKENLSMSVAQYHAWKDLMKFNSRNTQNAPGKENLIKSAAGRKK